ncbi:unnamed protein product [Phytophthora lilii]|uniref:Unnamed protein product n=1 Tax=Phytophthora lilii TaxID=2077276 RepID=A0A9W6TFC1_9STRA|nr:unnamed protein product [Phytophthora lilii]
MSDTQIADQFLYQSSLKADPSVRVFAEACALNGAEGFSCLRDAYIMLPYKVSMKNTHASQALGAAANRLSCGLKCGVWNVTDAMSLELSGKSILSMTEYKMFVNNLRAQAECSPAYVEKHGAETFLYPDSSGSLQWSSNATTYGDGYSNVNVDTSASLATSADGAAMAPANEGFVKRLLANPPVSNVNTNGWPTIAVGASKTISNQFGRDAFVAGTTAEVIRSRQHYRDQLPV